MNWLSAYRITNQPTHQMPSGLAWLQAPHADYGTGTPLQQCLGPVRGERGATTFIGPSLVPGTGAEEGLQRRPGLGRPSGSLLSSWLLCAEHQGEGDSGPLDHPGCGGHGDREEGVQGAVGSVTLGHCRVWLCPPLHLSLITTPSQTPAFSPLFSIPQGAAKSLWVLEIPAPSA